jgi:hypothetical protein
LKNAEKTKNISLIPVYHRFSDLWSNQPIKFEPRQELRKTRRTDIFGSGTAEQ